MACDAEHYGFQMLNDDEIVTSVQEESDPIDDEMDEDEDNNNENVSGIMYYMDRIRFSVIRTITYPNDVRSKLNRINDVLLYL
ncbi:hypothetical protein TNCV_4303961 [Trichonephila clavipes]|nr:hypothetical protein TNCV_4303961 [Trichonephila clavipes]